MSTKSSSPPCSSVSSPAPNPNSEKGNTSVKPKRTRLRRTSSGSFAGQYRFHVSLGSTTLNIPLAEPPQQLFFDATLGELVEVRAAADKLRVLRHAIAPSPPLAEKPAPTAPAADTDAPTLPRLELDFPPRECEIPNTGRVEALGFSGDGLTLAVQRRDDTLELRHVVEGWTWLHTTRSVSGARTRILGAHFPNPHNLLLVTSHAVEYYSFVWTKSGAQLKLIKDYRGGIAWYQYSPQLRVLLCASSTRTSELTGYHFGNRLNTHTRLPKFDLHAKTDASPVLKSEVIISQIYQGIFCIYINYKRNELVLYQISKDAVVPKLTIDLHTSGPVQVYLIFVTSFATSESHLELNPNMNSIHLDNLIITHNLSQQVSMIFDIKLRSPQDTRLSFPIAAPLPLSPVSASGETLSAQLYEDDWKFYLPAYVVSEKQGRAWRLQLNLKGIVAAFSDRVKLVDFLLRREHSQELLLRALRAALLERESLSVLANVFDMLNKILAAHLARQRAAKPGSAGGEDVLTTQRTVTFWKSFLRQQHESGWQPTPPRSTASESKADSGEREREEAEAREAFEVVEEPLVASFEDPDLSPDDESNGSLPNQATPIGAISNDGSSIGTDAGNEQSGVGYSPKLAPRFVASSPQLVRTEGYLVVEQEQIYTHVLLPVEEEGVLDSPYLVAVVVEYIRTLNYQHIPVKSFLYEFIIDHLVRGNRFYELHQFLQYHVIADSLHVACQLLSLANTYAPSYQLALDMLKRLGAHDQIVEVMLTKGLVIQALRYAFKLHKRIPNFKLIPRRFLEAAREDSHLFFTVYNFFDQNGLIDSSLADFQSLYRELFLEEPAS